MSLTPLSKNSVTMNGIQKAGTGWDYDDPYLTYDGATDSEGRAVLYDSIGSTITMTPQTKNSVSLSGQSKNSI